jgi:hypothetical protein
MSAAPEAGTDQLGRHFHAQVSEDFFRPGLGCCRWPCCCTWCPSCGRWPASRTARQSCRNTDPGGGSNVCSPASRDRSGHFARNAAIFDRGGVRGVPPNGCTRTDAPERGCTGRLQRGQRHNDARTIARTRSLRTAQNEQPCGFPGTVRVTPAPPEYGPPRSAEVQKALENQRSRAFFMSAEMQELPPTAARICKNFCKNRTIGASRL